MRAGSPATVVQSGLPGGELTALATHAHPSVAAMARSMLAGTNVAYQGDPLRDLTLTAFLDKFMQKKPKVGCLFHRQICSQCVEFDRA